jgi:hypothetical protein
LKGRFVQRLSRSGEGVNRLPKKNPVVALASGLCVVAALVYVPRVALATAVFADLEASPNGRWLSIAIMTTHKLAQTLRPT